MSSPAEISPQPDTQFDPLAFWIQHKTKVLLLAGLLVVGLLGYALFHYTQERAREAAQRDFAAAKSSEEYRKVIANHPRSVVAGNAQLLLADQLRGEGKNEEAVNTLNTFIEKQPEHPLISGAWTSLGYSQEAQGKEELALNTFQKVAATYPTSFSAPIALMAQARIHKTRGDIDQAKRLFEQVISQFGQSDFAREALSETRKLTKPAPTLSTAPAPPAPESATAPPADAPVAPTPSSAPIPAAADSAEPSPPGSVPSAPPVPAPKPAEPDSSKPGEKPAPSAEAAPPAS